MKLEEEIYIVSDPKYLGKIAIRKDTPCVITSTESPKGFFTGEEGPDGWSEYFRMDKMHELPDIAPLKISFKKFEKEQIEKTGRKDWWNYEKLK